MSMRGNSSSSSGSENRKRDKEYASSLVPEVLEDLRKPDNYHRLRDRNSRSVGGSRIGSSSSSGGSSTSSGSMLSTGERKRGNTASSSDRSGSGTVVLATEKRDKYASGARRDSLVGGGGSGSSGSSSSIGGGSGSGSGRKEGRGVDSLPPALKEDLEIFKRELVKHLRKEMSRLKDDLIDDLRREFAAFRQN
jgi:hypothetical protein